MWELDCEESWAPKNWCFWTVVLEKTLESPLDCKEIQPVHPKGDQSWVFIGRTDTEAETPILWPPHTKSSHWKRLWCWERLGAGGEGDDRDGWMAPPTPWTWVWVNSGSWWWTGRPGVLGFVGSQRVGHAWATELNWTIIHNTITIRLHQLPIKSVNTSWSGQFGNVRCTIKPESFYSEKTCNAPGSHHCSQFPLRDKITQSLFLLASCTLAGYPRREPGKAHQAFI